MRIIVTGANGYLGRGIVKQLLDDGHSVIAADFKIDTIDSRAEKVECDIFSISNPYEFFKQPDILLHLAWRNGFIHNAISHMDDLVQHYKFLKDFFDEGIDKIAVLGTMHEIGFYEGSIDENTPTNPQSLYGIAKNALRNSLFILEKDSKTTLQWIRGYYIVGNTEYGSSIFSKITLAEKEGKKMFPFTSGLNQWDFIDYDVFCNQVSKIVSQNRITGIINACSGRPEKLADRVERFIRENNYAIKLAYGTFPDRPYDSKAVWGNDTKIKMILENSENIS
ncbi:MAG: NAD(P)-dependent oxidoreductase [Ruminococcus flavefaciens]|nr:NAD(P)-dependent oxidoreductase [Ruminococcus flavefaciens]